MNRHAVSSPATLWRWVAAGAGVLFAIAAASWWISSMLWTPEREPGPGAADELLEQARGRLGAGDFPQARALYRQALEQQAQQKATHAVASTWEELGALEQGAQRWSAARAAYADAARNYAALQDRAGQARVLRRAAALEFHTGHYRAALEALKQALAAQDPADVLARGQLMVSAAEAEIKLGLLDAAGVRLHEAGGVLAGRDDYRSHARMLEVEGTIQLRRGEVSEARQRYASALDQYRAAGDVLGSARALKGMADLERTGRARRGSAGVVPAGPRPVRAAEGQARPGRHARTARATSSATSGTTMRRARCMPKP